MMVYYKTKDQTEQTHPVSILILESK